MPKKNNSFSWGELFCITLDGKDLLVCIRINILYSFSCDIHFRGRRTQFSPLVIIPDYKPKVEKFNVCLEELHFACIVHSK